MKNQKGAASLVVVIAVVIVALVAGYFAFQNKPEVKSSISESEILSKLNADWTSAQALVPIRPTYHNQAENETKVWRNPNSIQFIGNNHFLIEIEDDNNAYVVVLSFDGDKFSLSELFQNQSNFSQDDWQGLVSKYGDSKYPVDTYTKELIRNKEIVSFDSITKVPENVFLKEYYNSNTTADETANWQTPSVKIIQPDKYENWSAGYTKEIKWEAQNLPESSVLEIFLETEKSTPGAVHIKELNPIPNNGEYDLKIPAQTVIYGDIGYSFSGKYYLTLKVYDGVPCVNPPAFYECPPESKNIKVIASDKSKELINIIPLSAQSSQIKIVSPLAGSSVNGGKDYTIRWTGGESKIKISLIEITGTGSNTPLRFENLPNTGSFTVKFPNKESQYRIVLFDEVGHSARVDGISVLLK